MNFRKSYFSIKSPLQLIDRWINPFHHQDNIEIRGKKMAINYSKRAEKALHNREKSLVAELQLYFTCVVQKRVLFHDETKLETIKVNPKLEVIYHALESNSCDPTEFAEKHPVKRELKSKAAKLMRPSSLQIDFKDGQWIGEFSI